MKTGIDLHFSAYYDDHLQKYRFVITCRALDYFSYTAADLNQGFSPGAYNYWLVC